MENYQDYKLWCVKLKDLTQLYFLTDYDIQYCTNSQSKYEVMYPMVGTVNDIGIIEFDFYVEYSESKVSLILDDIRAITHPVAPIEKLYRQSIRRIEFLQSQPESSRKILEETMKELKIKANGGKTVSAYDYRKEIIKQTDKMLNAADGIIEPDEEILDNPNLANVVDITKHKPNLH